MTERIPTAYDAVVFDNDGVIVEPTDRQSLADALQEALHEFGRDPDRGRIERAVAVGAGPRETLETVGLDGEFDDLEAFWRRREELAAATQISLIRNGRKTLYDDVPAIERLDAAIGMVSNNQHDTVSFIVDHYDLAFFDVVYGRAPTVTGAERKKPDPHYLERALADLGTRNALYVGDSEVDIRAARRAGVDSAFLRRDHSTETDLSAEPTYEVPDLQALLTVVRED
jgi:HAD superfamily hydrolase (TIGR01549 family)